MKIYQKEIRLDLEKFYYSSLLLFKIFEMICNIK